MEFLRYIQDVCLYYNTVELGYNELGYNELPFIVNKKLSLVGFRSV
jgi:hypothetical protein